MKNLLKITIAILFITLISSCASNKKTGCYFKEKMIGY